MEHDPIITFRKQLVDAAVAPDSAFDEIIENARSLVTKTLKLAIDDSVSPRMDLNKDTQAIAKLMFSNQRIEKMEERECEVLMPKEENPQWKRVQKKERFGLDKDGKPVSKNRVYQLRDGLLKQLLINSTQILHWLHMERKTEIGEALLLFTVA